ncbi:hypothetical protein P0Y35_10160 [Kiritimatiellaeota bacterium B1221]|nr:hypothetical protein [Kiritimatiellaeota bacterium B1221]
MQHSRFTFIFSLVFLLTNNLYATPTDTLTSFGITWKFDRPVENGTFVTGDPWIIGPAKVISISNNKNDPDYSPRRGQNGSMLNPLSDPKERSHQGYDDGLKSYKESLNAALPNGNPVSASNPILLHAGDTLISMVSWLYTGASDKEPGTPGFNGGTKAPRPVTRSASILTVLDKAPPANSFRPAYVKGPKDHFYTLADIKWDRLKNLSAPASAPDASDLIQNLERPWVDHVFEFLGAMIHPSEHMPNYGRNMGNIIADATLLVNTDIPLKQKQKLSMYLIQYGIDLTGIADAGGGWRANGGHGLGRKWPILFTGMLLDNSHMLKVGEWDRSFNQGVEFQEDQNYFYVSEAEVKLTNSDQWNPDHRNVQKGQALPYTPEDIGMPEWGIRHAYKPQSDNKHMDSNYRDINGGVTPGFALAALIMGAREAWNHDPFFDYQDRYIPHPERPQRGTNAVNDFVLAMWEMYRSDYTPVWSSDAAE